jgi:diacylglycerol kinase (ATP)
MSNTEQDYRALFKTLRESQHRHKKLLVRVERTSTRLQRRKAKLLAIEARIADCERKLAEPHKQHVGSPQGDGAKKLLRAQLIFNPNSGKDQSVDSATRLANIAACLRSHGIAAQIGIKTSGKSARGLAADAVRAKWPLVIVAGGDGTVEDVAGQLAGSTTALGIVPIGTMNNLARSLGVPLEIDEACALIGMGTTRHIDLGRVFADDGSKVCYFLEAGGVGLGALAAMAGQALEKKRWGILPGAVSKIVTSKPTAMKVALDDVTLEVTTCLVTVSNAPLMGKNLLIAPDAKMDDGLMDVTVYDGMGEPELIKYLKDLSAGTAERIPSYRTRKVCITSETPVVGNTDKELTPSRRVLEIEILPRALSMIVGNGIALSVPVESAPIAQTFGEKPAPAEGSAEEAAAEGKPANG